MDSTTISHILNERCTFIDFMWLASSSIMGVGDKFQALGHGTVILLSVKRLDELVDGSESHRKSVNYKTNPIR